MSRRTITLILVTLAAAGCGASHRADPPAGSKTSTAAKPAVHRRPPAPRIHRLTEHSTGRLASPTQDEAIAPAGGNRALLLGGLTAADTSRTDIRLATTTSDTAAGALPVGLHDTAAVRLGSSVYLFGGGTASNTQSSDILRVPATGGTPALVGHLPQGSSDQSAAAIGSTAYVVGGYTGSVWLDTIVAFRPATGARVVAHLPYTLRYAAVASVDGQLVIAGGSLENGTASDEVLAWRPGEARPRRIGTLPAATTHAAAAAIGHVVYVVGGRSATLDTPTTRIVAVDPARRKVAAAGSLASPRSDLAAVSFGSRILLAGGRGASGTEDGLSVLVPGAAATSKPRTTASTTTTASAFAPPPARNVYGFDAADQLTGAARTARPLVYVPNSESNTVDEIDPRTHHIVRSFATGGLPQHIVPAWDLRTLYVTNDTGNTLTPIDPRTGTPRAQIPVEDPYNLYFTPDGRFAIVVAERLRRLDFRDPHTFALRHTLNVPCVGVDHMDFTADGRYLLASCEFSGQMLVVAVRTQRVVRTIQLPDGYGGMPQDVKLAPDGRTFFVADMRAGGLWKIDARSFRVRGFLRTGGGAHGLYPSRDARDLYVSNRSEGTVSVVSFATEKVVKTWRIPGGSPDMGGVSADGRVLWLSGRYNSEVYALSTRTGRLLARIPVGAGPHGVCVWPQPGRYSLGHTGILR